jgi:hypothetical protein
MHFAASIRRPSPIHRDWIKRSRPKVGGTINGVPFKLQGKTYVSDALSAHQVEALRGHPHVILEITGISTLPAAYAPEPAPEPVPEPEPEVSQECIQTSDKEEPPAPVKRGPGRQKKST